MDQMSSVRVLQGCRWSCSYSVREGM